MYGSAIPIFEAGASGYACFRIPALIALPSGRLIAMAEGRKGGCSDTGDIDLVQKVSDDGGSTWSDLQVIWNDGDNTCGNPVPIWDAEAEKLVLLSTWNLGADHEREIIDQVSEDTRRIFVLESTNQGNTWREAREITADVKLDTWTWYATGPGSGLQVTAGPYAGRLIAGCDHIEAGTKKYFSHSIFSDDHGKTWQLGGTTPRDQVNECEVAELPGGTLMLNMRNYDRNNKMRQVAYSTDGGTTWTNQGFDSTLIEPICQASLHSTHLGTQHLLLFSNPASQDKRENMTLRLSMDGGSTWDHSLVLHPGPSAYSDIAVGSDQQIFVLYEGGEEQPYEEIRLRKVLLE